jgi:thiol-disulfide isomerase/thioredoxin
MNPRIPLCCCILMISLCVPCLGMADEAAPPTSQPAASTQETPLVWAVAAAGKFDAAHTYSGMWPAGVAAVAVHPLDSGKLGVFLAQPTLPNKELTQRVVFVDEAGARHVADCGGRSWTDSVCMTFYRTPKSCPLKSVRRILIEQQVPETDPLVQRQKEYEQREARKPELAKQSPLPALVTGKPYPFVLTDASGGRVDGKQLVGKVVILDFWATWCGPCVAEIPRLKGLYERYHKQGLEIVSVDMGEDPQKVAAFARAKDIPWTQAVLSSAEYEAVSAATEIEGIPHFLVLDSRGILRDADAPRQNLEKIVAGLLAAKAEQKQ